MLCAIDLNNQPRLETYEIQDIAIDRNLRLEFPPKLTTPQSLPKQILSLGGITAHRFGELPMSIRNIAMQEFSRFRYHYREKHEASQISSIAGIASQ